MSAFTSAGVSAGLLGKIDQLERTVPVARTVELGARSSHSEFNSSESSQNENHGRATSGTTSGVSSANGSTSSSVPSAALVPFSPLSLNTRAAGATPAKQPSNGIISLAEDLNSLHAELDAERDGLDATAQFHRSLDRFRDPLRTQLRAIDQRGQSLSAQPQSNDPVVLAYRRKQIKSLTADFKHLAAIVLPLAKVDMLLDATSNNLTEWRSETQRTYSILERGLLLRIGTLVLAIILIIVAADFWRRAIFRYIEEPRRRNQFLLLRRIVVTGAIALIFILALSTDIGALATFFGFLSAGLPSRCRMLSSA